MQEKTLEDLRRAGCWIFDLDNTLYPHSCDLFPQVEKRMTEFICRHLSLDWDGARALQKKYFHRYGTTLRGLMQCNDIDADDFLSYVHDIDYSILSYDSGLDDVLGRLAARKIIFTNGSAAHAERVLERLRIASHFDFIFDIKAADYIPKPQAQAYDILLARLGGISGGAVMVEDIAKNLHYPYECGMATLWIENGHEFARVEKESHIDFKTKDLAGFLRDAVTAVG